jgi:hypothetical protein
MKTIDLVCSSTPDKPEFGWGDHIDVYDGTTPIYGCSASCCPNPYRVSSRGSPIPWQLCYGWIAEGEYDYVCVDKGLLLDDGGVVPSMGGLDHLSNVFYGQERPKKDGRTGDVRRETLQFPLLTGPFSLRCSDSGNMGGYVFVLIGLANIYKRVNFIYRNLTFMSVHEP